MCQADGPPDTPKGQNHGNDALRVIAVRVHGLPVVAGLAYVRTQGDGSSVFPFGCIKLSICTARTVPAVYYRALYFRTISVETPGCHGDGSLDTIPLFYIRICQHRGTVPLCLPLTLSTQRNRPLVFKMLLCDRQAAFRASREPPLVTVPLSHNTGMFTLSPYEKCALRLMMYEKTQTRYGYKSVQPF